MSDYNDNDLEFINLGDLDEPVENDAAPVGGYQYMEEADDIFEEAASRYNTGNPKRKQHSGSSSKSRAERRRRRKRKLLIRRIVFGCSLVVFISCIVVLVNIFVNYDKADKIYNNVEQSVFASTNNTNNNNTSSPTSSNAISDNGILTNYDHAALLEINPEAQGYLQIPSLDLLLPVVQTDNNDYYLTHAISGETSKNGTLFIDSRNDLGIDSENAIIYGHCMKNGSMFGSLSKYNTESFYLEDGNKYMYFYTEDHIYQYEIYSVHTTPAISETYTTIFPDSDTYFSYINSMSSVSFYETSAQFTEVSKTITLSTCTNDDNTRLVIQAVRIGDINSSTTPVN